MYFTFNSSTPLDVLYYLNATGSPSITTPPDLTVLAPEAAVLSCSVMGFPLPTVSWVMVDNDENQRPVTAEESVTITETNSAISLTSNLAISPTDIGRSGRYVCVATNVFGMANESALLTVNGKKYIMKSAQCMLIR